LYDGSGTRVVEYGSSVVGEDTENGDVGNFGRCVFRREKDRRSIDAVVDEDETMVDERTGGGWCYLLVKDEDQGPKCGAVRCGGSGFGCDKVS
jgi:hypothetical protein